MASVHRFRLPKRILLVRHGESLGNADSTAYQRIPDWKIPLTATGVLQAQQAGIKIKNIIKEDPITIYCSPYIRTKQTLLHVMDHLKSNHVIDVREEPRLTEQQFGNFQNPRDMSICKHTRLAFGRFYYRFPQGESGLDCYNRVTSFMSTLFRDWKKGGDDEMDNLNVVMVTHGLLIRLFLLRWFQYTVDDFERTHNPENAAVIIMERTTTSSSSNAHSDANSEHMILTEESRKAIEFSRYNRFTMQSAGDVSVHLQKILDSAKNTEVPEFKKDI